MSWGKLLAIGGVLGGAAGMGYISFKLLTDKEHTLKNYEPEEPAAAGGDKTGYPKVDKILGKLRAAARSSGIPLGLLVGWIARESRGKLDDTTSLDERGYFQLMPGESTSIGVDHERLSTDSDYSIDAGVKLINHYQTTVSNLGVANAGSSYYWRLVKLVHSMGGGQVKKVVTAAKAAGSAGSWGDLESFALDMKINGPQPKKWFPFVDSIYKIGRPFGFGSEQSPAIVGFVEDPTKSGFDNFLDYIDWDNARKRGVDVATIRYFEERDGNLANAPMMGHGGHGGGGRGGRGRGGGRGWGPGWYGGPWYDYALDFDEQSFIDAVARRVKDLDSEGEALGGLSLLGAEV